MHHPGRSNARRQPVGDAGKISGHQADCTVCGRGFAALAAAEVHAIEHAGWVACTECGETMPAKEYRLHRKKRHTRREFECPCGASFYTQKKLEFHKREVHTGPWYRCGRCLVICKSWKAFKRHAEGPLCAKNNPLYTEPEPGQLKRSGDVPEPHIDSVSVAVSVAVDEFEFESDSGSGSEAPAGADSNSVSESESESEKHPPQSAHRPPEPPPRT